MFTGLVQFLGSLVSLTRAEPSELILKAELPDSVRVGDSVSVNGACLTVVRIEKGQYAFNLGQETLRLSNFADLQPGSLVNLELAMTLNDRLGGHLVSGHLDGTARLKTVRKLPGSTVMSFFFTEREWTRLMITKGSIALNGVSLTLHSVSGQEFTIEVIPHTLAETNLKTLKNGERVNVELDLLGKYLYNFNFGKK